MSEVVASDYCIPKYEYVCVYVCACMTMLWKLEQEQQNGESNVNG